MLKVKEVNLEYGNPATNVAVMNMVNKLTTCKAKGYKAVVLIHGYGSSGIGGSIKVEVRNKLKERSLSGLVRSYCGGEDWLNKKRQMIDVCPQLKDFNSRIDGNKGVTVVLLK
ncbi:hypothetical protein [Anaerovorax odorimutans]|uniref:hypothetical protein n=1 Tax=Anaerovorax odorimutans TaxID=109327 RepID=UPI000414D317|nr:hypothetical protein [Anaerovorax odorimutans]